MDYQLSLRLPDSLTKTLDEAAIRMGCKRSEVVRLASEPLLGTHADFRPIERTRDLLGKVKSGI